MNEHIGIIGAGTIADAYYIPTLRSLGFNRISVSDVNEQQARNVAHRHSVRQLKVNELIDTSPILIIATPPHTHYTLLKQCIIAGNRTVICEKPFLFSGQEAKDILALSHLHHSHVMVAHLRRCFSAIELARHFLSNFSTGALRKVDMWEGARFTYKPQSDYTTQNTHGGVLLDTGSHVLDCFLYVSGLTQTEMKCKVTSVQKDKQEPAHEVNYSFKLDSIVANLHLSRYKALSNKMTLHYENVSVEIPLGLKPNIAVTTNGKRELYTTDKCFNYMTEVFRAELSDMLIQQQKSRFEAKDFVQLSSILEQLFNA